MESITRREFLGTTAAGVATVVAGCAHIPQSIQQELPFDIIIKGGVVVDGTGTAGSPGGRGVKRDGRIKALDITSRCRGSTHHRCDRSNYRSRIY